MKRRNRIATEPVAQRKEIYDKALSFLLALLAILIPLKFGLPNLDIATPTVPLDLSGIGQYLGNFFRAIFSLDLLSALQVVSEVLSTPWPEEMAQILIILAFFLWGMKSFSQRSFVLRLSKIDAAMWLFILTGLVATVLSPGFHSSVVILKQFVSYALLYFLAVHAVESPHQQRRILKCFLVSTSIVALLALYQFFLGFEDVARSVKRYIPPELQIDYLVRVARRRVYSVFVYPNSLAGFLLVAFPLTVLYAAMHRDWFKRKNLVKLIAYAVVLPLACLVSFLLTQSKAGFLTFFIVAVASIIAGRKKVGLKPRAHLASLLAVFVLVGAAVLSPLGRKLVVEKGRFTLGERLDYWTTGYRMFLKSPVIGNGFNSFELLYPRYRSAGAGEARTAHNNFLQILVETGVVGFLFFGAVWVLALAAARPFLRDYLRGEKTDPLRQTIVLSAFIGILCFLIHSLADYDLYIPGIAMTVWLFLGLMVNNARPEQGRLVRLTKQWATACTIGLLGFCAFCVFYASKTLNASSHLALAQSIVGETDPPPGYVEFERAIAEAKKAAKWDGANHNVHVFLAGTYFRLKQYDEALREYAVADRLLHHLSPTIAHHKARAMLARMKAQGSTEWDKVLDEFRKAASRSPASPFHGLVYAYYLSQAGRQEQSHKELRHAKRLDPSGEQALKTASILYRDEPFVDELRAFFQGTENSSRPRGTSAAEKGAE